MSAANPIRHISDTALWVAVYRAQESERADAVFRDLYARKLAGDRGMRIAAAMPFAKRHSWSYVARTWLVDQIIEREVLQGTDMVINLAAGLDSRPYRMQLSASLRWIVRGGCRSTCRSYTTSYFVGRFVDRRLGTPLPQKDPPNPE
jgi:hypothetical protein